VGAASPYRSAAARRAPPVFRPQAGFVLGGGEIAPLHGAGLQVRHHAGDPAEVGFFASRLQQQDLPAGHFGEAGGQDGARGPRPHHDEVVASEI
jgi:hypothetical protein